jgi:hypothetical protein
MTNPSKRDSAPGRERPDYERPGTFKPGHEKRGGRKPGTPNAFSADYRRAIREAAYRVGEDGNGKDGLIGYLRWVARRHPVIYCSALLMNVLPLEYVEDAPLDQPRPTKVELNDGFASMSDSRARTIRSAKSRLRRDLHGIGPGKTFP